MTDVKRNDKGQFLKGITPHNKGKHLEDYISNDKIENIKKTQFKKGNLPHTALEKGHVSGRKHYKKGELVGIDWMINIDWHGNRHPNYMYRRYLWEVENQQDAPKDMVFVAKNGDQSEKPTIDNIEMITRQELIRRNNPRI